MHTCGTCIIPTTELYACIGFENEGVVWERIHGRERHPFIRCLLYYRLEKLIAVAELRRLATEATISLVVKAPGAETSDRGCHAFAGQSADSRKHRVSSK